jgi:hypothetical protein
MLKGPSSSGWDGKRAGSVNDLSVCFPRRRNPRIRQSADTELVKYDKKTRFIQKASGD